MIEAASVEVTSSDELVEQLWEQAAMVDVSSSVARRVANQSLRMGLIPVICVGHLMTALCVMVSVSPSAMAMPHGFFDRHAPQLLRAQ